MSSTSSSDASSADTSRYTQSIFLPYVHKFSSKSVPMVNAVIDGIDFQLPMDTGSTGLLVGAPLLPHIGHTQGTPAYEFLTSSWILYTGRLVDLTITFHGSNQTIARATVPVLVVDKSVVCPWYDPSSDTFHCPHGPNGEEPTARDTSRITYMGVGFGRNRPGDGQPHAVPRGNPFLNIESVNGQPVRQNSWWCGYTLSTKGVRLGLTEANIQGFNFTALDPGVTHDDDPRDWDMVNMAFSINGKGENCGPALVDTGISQMYIRAEEGVSIPTVTVRNPNKNGTAKWVQRVKPGTAIAVGFPSLNESRAAGYAFEVGKGTLMEPDYVVPAKPGRPPLVNTGRNFLFGYAVAFDAAGGRFGFRAVQPPCSESDPIHSSL
ncbi:hypothetical protein BDV95DRAFT_609947 [Massariosphaeria phaeospora]|uniref:Aspartic peptidase domain-containing protein n=1 Tax=Massariosphaeria phaeospora TaxID=100035 RepID=A0A7C8I1N2_9PLEO|nr:hypothetical protein BDV95DRAFT_609947 [Massariosphaeria phaeospora]